MKQRMPQNGDVEPPPPPPPVKDDTKDTILQTSRLFVRNLAFSCTDEELADLFKPFGEISQVSFLVILLFFPGDFFFFVRNTYYKMTK